MLDLQKYISEEITYNHDSFTSRARIKINDVYSLSVIVIAYDSDVMETAEFVDNEPNFDTIRRFSNIHSFMSYYAEYKARMLRS